MRWAFLLVLAGALAPGVAACGGGKKKSETSTTQGTRVKGKQGGKLTMLWANDTDFIDPGATYYQMGFMLVGATQDMLYWYKPDNSTDAVPLLAQAAPQISPDGKTVTVKIRQGVKFSPPVNRVVTSKDVKYAVERGFFKTVNNGYAGAYFGNVVGAKTAVNAGTAISGITTPDDQTVVFKLSKPTGGVLAGALALPLAAPVPEEYAKKFDKQNPSTYGNNQVATGPYMIKNDASGKAVGYSAGKDIHLVRNPRWNKSLDFRPA